MALFSRKSFQENESTTPEPAASEEDRSPTVSLVHGDDAPEADQHEADQSMPSDTKSNDGSSLMSSRPQSAGFVPEIPRRTIDLPGAPRRPAAGARGSNPEGKKLIVGREISLSGEITACDSLVVEGTVQATLENSRALEVSETGVYRGTVVIDEAVIAGSFEGDLTARDKLTIKATGRIKGSVKFRRIEIELGGEVDGQISPLPGDAEQEPATGS